MHPPTISSTPTPPNSQSSSITSGWRAGPLLLGGLPFRGAEVGVGPVFARDVAADSEFRDALLLQLSLYFLNHSSPCAMSSFSFLLRLKSSSISSSLVFSFSKLLRRSSSFRLFEASSFIILLAFALISSASCLLLGLGFGSGSALKRLAGAESESLEMERFSCLSGVAKPLLTLLAALVDIDCLTLLIRLGLMSSAAELASGCPFGIVWIPRALRRK